MNVTIPGFVVPIKAATVSINGRRIMLSARKQWPVFEVGARELKGIEHLMGPITVDFPKPAAKTPKPAAKTPKPAQQTQAPAAADS